jgi:hypothetical protein
VDHLVTAMLILILGNIIYLERKVASIDTIVKKLQNCVSKDKGDKDE